MNGQEYDVIATVSPRSVGPYSVFDESVAITKENAAQFASDPSDVRDCIKALTRAGFHVFKEASDPKGSTVQIGGSAKLFKEFFGAKITKQKAEIGPGVETTFMATSEEPAEALMKAPDDFADLIEGAVVARPPIYFAPSPIPPIATVHANAYPYFRVPDGIAVMLRAARVHRLGVTGKGVVVAMPDTGMYKHPFYAERGYRVYKTLLAPGATDPNDDMVGHGTGEAANVFACAPDARLIPVKMGNDTTGAINTAVNATPTPQVITNSWGYDADRPGTSIPIWLKPLELAIANAVASGIVVCFSAGNGHFGFPGSHPDVISVGGVHVNLPDITDFEASSYVSSFMSTWYPGRASPDLCGLTGKRVNIGGGKAPSILLPVQEGAQLDTIDPPTGPGNDGWGLFSGTSAACPQIAGIVALMLEKNPALTPVQVKDKLMKSARDVKKGTTAHGETAVAGPDLATGAGLADAKWAYLNTMGDVATAFFAAPKEEQLAMVSSGKMPEISTEFVEDLIETLRSR
ncbi:Serine protease AprX [Defluviimonas aquaemixtae]|uniref:Serine protease AprX n=1 Tax=Albidovulum aquaemixtae TaxID=1542388 RepID=A0A2R8BJZ5_9RHOB|nr:S8 family serine peptidase [Defluviimonas aquaemixtae]SPH23633.1 Serine protease AprX [Defluviimonas aquaemixtae]